VLTCLVRVLKAVGSSLGACCPYCAVSWFLSVRLDGWNHCPATFHLHFSFPFPLGICTTLFVRYHPFASHGVVGGCNTGYTQKASRSPGFSHPAVTEYMRLQILPRHRCVLGHSIQQGNACSDEGSPSFSFVLCVQTTRAWSRALAADTISHPVMRVMHVSIWAFTSIAVTRYAGICVYKMVRCSNTVFRKKVLYAICSIFLVCEEFIYAFKCNLE
jgi:hypothetical protein